MSMLSDARDELSGLCVATHHDSTNTHIATFEPLATRVNLDRTVVQKRDIAGQRWLLLMACDAEYAISVLPKRFRKGLRYFVKRQLHGAVRKFDDELGEAVKKICPTPETLSDEQSETLVRQHRETIQRASAGTTLVAAIFNVHNRCMWTVSIGDSTVGISSVNADGRRDGLTTPREHFRVAIKHPRDELSDLGENDRILGHLAMTRALGDFAMKLGRPCNRSSVQIPSAERRHRALLRPRTPSYISSRPSVRFMDLEPHYHAVVSQLDRSVDPGRVVAGLIGDASDRMEAAKILGHSVEPQWRAPNGNRAVEVLVDLFGSADPERVRGAIDQARLASDADRRSMLVIRLWFCAL
ncbi:hypothetical protein BD414DRAFT_511300 [Trametes punicea]|nr:hypothetical protein BD414DRAFT_511300 [Trametes punicea]